MSPELVLKGIAASEGIAIGPAFLYLPPDLNLPNRCAEAPDVEFERFRTACEQARQELESLQVNLSRRPKGEELAQIFAAHQVMLEDPMLVDCVRQKINDGMAVEQAVQEATQELAALLAGMAQELFAARAADVRDIGQRLLRILLGRPERGLENLLEPAVIVAQDLTPSDTANLNPQLVLGFCTAGGGLTSHSAILARTLGLPAVVGLGTPLLTTVNSQQLLIMDGSAGTLILQPEPETLRRYQELKGQRHSQLQVIKARAQQEAVTADGQRVEVAANIGEVSTAQTALEFGAEGVGLLRTEFLYLNEAQPPDEVRQMEIYRQIFEVMGQRPVIVRTLDIGGDKPPSYLPFPQEMNPFLGWRAIRICLETPELFKTQLRAILRAAIGHNVRIMFPMINSLEELLCARDLVQRVQSELQEEGLAYAAGVPIGIMVETPAAAVLVDILAEAADFFSLGTNDLTQYTLAVDRGNEKVAGLFQPLHPAVLRLIKMTIETAHRKGRWVGMCGELAGMPKAIPILLGLGLDEFSMAPGAIPAAKELIRRLTLPLARQIAAHALELPTADEIENYMEDVLRQLNG